MSWHGEPFRLPHIGTGRIVMVDGRWRCELRDGFTFQRRWITRRAALGWLLTMQGCAATAEAEAWATPWRRAQVAREQRRQAAGSG